MILTQASAVHSHIPGRKIKRIEDFNVKDFRDLERIGITVARTFDSNQQAPLTTPTIPTPIQFLQNWLPGVVRYLTAARKADELVGVSTVGSWEDEQIIQTFVEPLRSAVPYGDVASVPFSSWNANFLARTIVRFEMGLESTILAAARASRIQLDDIAEKRAAAAVALEIARNTVAFYGFNGGLQQTYGFLTDPTLPAYYTVPAGASGSTQWKNKTLLEIDNDIRTALANLRTNSIDNVDPENTDITLALPTNTVDQLTQTSEFGYGVRRWMGDSYPRIRVVSAPQLNGANGGANVGYLYADSIADGSTDGGQTFMHAVPQKFMALGVQQLAKGSIEDYSNATAGVFCKRPWAVVRFSGI